MIGFIRRFLGGEEQTPVAVPPTPALSNRELRERLLKIRFRGDKHSSLLGLVSRLPDEQKIALLSEEHPQASHAFIIEILHFGHEDIARALLDDLDPEQKFPLLNITNQMGYTALMYAAGTAENGAIKALFRGLSIEQKLILLNQANNNGSTALQIAIQPGHALNIQTFFEGLSVEQRLALLNKVDASACNALLEASKRGRAETIEALVIGLSADQKFALLSKTETQGNNALILANRHSNCLTVDTVNALLSGLKDEQVVSLLTQSNLSGRTALESFATIRYDAECVRTSLQRLTPAAREALLDRNNLGTRLITSTFEYGLHHIVDVLQGFGVRLPDRLRQNEEKVNAEQSTHTATVHDSLARSAIALAARYLTLSAAKKKILLDWAHSKLASSDDAQKADAMVKVMNEDETQDQLGSLVNTCNTEMLPWLRSLDQTELINRSAVRACDSIMSEVEYKEERTKLSLPQTLALVWRGLLDKAFYDENEKGTVLKERFAALIRHLYETQREYNLDVEGNETDPTSDDDESCLPGKFNKLIITLATLHDDVQCVMVNLNTVQCKASVFMGELLQLNSLTDDERAELQDNFEVKFTYVLPQTVKEKLRLLVLPRLEQEFGEYAEAKLIKADTISLAMTRSLTVLQPFACQLIVSKLAANAEATASTSTTSAVPTEQPNALLTQLHLARQARKRPAEENDNGSDNAKRRDTRAG